MKLSNMFKKATKTSVKSNIEKLEKKQLETVVGGTETKSMSVKVTGDSIPVN